jgi:SET domain-containing protein
MYKEQLKVLPCKTGVGVFTLADIPAKTPILEVRGPIFAEKDLPDPNHPALLQIGPDTFLAKSGGMDDLINHSCSPNCYMYIAGNRAVLFSLYVIKAGSELTFDYSSTSTDTLDKWKMDCLCGEINCRKVISGYQYLDNATQQYMKAKEILPLYILHPDMFPKRF